MNFATHRLVVNVYRAVLVFGDLKNLLTDVLNGNATLDTLDLMEDKRVVNHAVFRLCYRI